MPYLSTYRNFSDLRQQESMARLAKFKMLSEYTYADSNGKDTNSVLIIIELRFLFRIA